MILAHQDGVPFVITWTEWPTKDGSGLPDYLYVWDVAGACNWIDRAQRLLGWRPYTTSPRASAIRCSRLCSATRSSPTKVLSAAAGRPGVAPARRPI
jgi:hypothetical protein